MSPTIDLEHARAELKAALTTGPHAGLFRDFFAQAGVVYPAALYTAVDELARSDALAEIRDQVPRTEVQDALGRLGITGERVAPLLSLLDQPGDRGLSLEGRIALEGIRNLVRWSRSDERSGCLPALGGRTRATAPPAAPGVLRVEGFADRSGARTTAAAPGALLRIQGSGLGDASSIAVRFDGEPALVWPAEGGGVLVAVPSPAVEASPQGPGRPPGLDFSSGAGRAEVTTPGDTAVLPFTIAVPAAATGPALEELLARLGEVLRGMGSALEPVSEEWAPYLAADPTGGLRTAVANLPSLLRQAAEWAAALEPALRASDEVLPGLRPLLGRIAEGGGLDAAVQGMERWTAAGGRDMCAVPLLLLDLVVEVYTLATAWMKAVIAALVVTAGLVTIVVIGVILSQAALVVKILFIFVGVSAVAIPVAMLLCLLARLGDLEPRPLAPGG